MKNVLRVVPCFAVLAVVMLAGCSSGHLPTAKDVGYAMGWWNVLSDEERVASLYGTEATEAQAAAAMKSYDALDGLTKTKVNFAAGEIFAGGFGSVGEWWETLNCRTMRIAAGDGNTADHDESVLRALSGVGKDAVPGRCGEGSRRQGGDGLAQPERSGNVSDTVVGAGAGTAGAGPSPAIAILLERSCPTGIRTPTNRSRVCRATVTPSGRAERARI